MIKLKCGQKVLGVDGNTYLVEKGDCLREDDKALVKKIINYIIADNKNFKWLKNDSYASLDDLERALSNAGYRNVYEDAYEDLSII